MVIANPAELDSTTPAQRSWMRANEIQYLIFVPLIFEGEHLGTLVITSRFSQVRTESRIRSLAWAKTHSARFIGALMGAIGSEIQKHVAEQQAKKPR